MWKPNDPEKFKNYYLAGMTDSKLANQFYSSVDRVKNYISAEKSKGELPARGEFDPNIVVIESVEENSDFLDLQLLKKIKSSKVAISINTLADEFDVSPRRIKEAIDKLNMQDYLIDHNDESAFFKPAESGRQSQHFFNYKNGNKFKFGVIADTHLCSKYTNYNVLNTMYDIFEAEGVEKVYLPGNYIDGEAKFNMSDLHVYGFENQVNFFVKHFPKRDGVSTYYIDGDDHEGWYAQRAMINVGQRVEDTAKRYGREDLHYLGYMEADVCVPAKKGCTKIRIQHPGGGSAYTLSYVPQKIVESLSGGEKPQILLLGHYHKAGYFFMRNIHIVLAACTENQTPFMRKKRLAAHLGGWICEVTQGDDGSVIGFTQTFYPFYDTSEEEEPWQYKGELEDWVPMVQTDFKFGDN